MENIGKMIENEVLKQGRSIPWLAEQLNCDRTNIYKIFKRENIDAELLLRLSNILQCNFFSYYIRRITFVNNSQQDVAKPSQKETY